LELDMLMEHDTEDPTLETSGRDDSGDAISAGQAGAADASEDGTGSSELRVAREERDRALAEKAELFDKFQRAQAEFDNWRKRLLREKQEQQEYAAMSTIESLLPIVDDFERAIETPGLDAEFKKGLELIYSRIIDVFTRAGMKPIDAEGDFNPHLHHAVDRAPAKSDEQDQTILEVYQKGYHFKDRLLRPAMVKVAVKE
jgi:molecular chaperone GrpE